MKLVQTYLPLSILVLMMGCKVGPDYYPPDPPMPLVYAEDRIDQTTAVADEELVRWWELFDDPFLDQLMEEAIGGSFDYRIALEQITQARALFWIQFATILPEFDADAQGSRFRTSQSFGAATSAATTGISPIQDFFQTGLDAVWEIDIFGKLRRSAQASFDTWEATIEEARAVKIVVLSEVATIYANICALQQKIGIYSQIVNVDDELLKLSITRYEAGLTNEQEVESYIAALNANQSALLLLQTSLKQNIYALAVLLGRAPETLLADFEELHPIPHASGLVPAGLPGDLLRRRPDISAAERQLASATEQIGVAVAALFPQVSLTGSSSSFAANPLQGANIGFSSNNISKLFSSPSRVWGYGLFVSFPVLDFGKRMAAVDAQVSVEQQTYLNYQKTVITALQEAEQSLVTYFNDENRLKDLSRAEQANQRNVELDSDLFQSGMGDYTQYLQAKALWLASVNTLTDSQLALTVDLIAVYKAMGGDW